MTHWWRTSVAAAIATLLTFLVLLSPIFAQSSNFTGWSSASDYTVLSGRSGTIFLWPGGSSAFRIGPILDVSSLELRTQNLEASNVTVWYCYSSDCTAATGMPLRDNATTRLIPSAFVWLKASVPNTTRSPLDAILEFSSTSPTSCSDPGQTPILLFPARTVGTSPPLSFLSAPAEASGPSYSLCVATPNNHPDFGLSFSWSWSFADLPPVFNGGFLAILPPFPLTLPLGVYDVNLVEALAPITGAPIGIRLAFLAHNNSVLAEFTESTTGFYVPAVNSIAQGTIEFYLPAGIGNQSAAVYTVRYMPSTPPMPPEPLDQICSPASSPYLVQYGRMAFTKIRIPYTTYVEGLGIRGGADGPTALTGGCAFRFPATTPAGDPIARHTLFLSSVPSNAAALAWLSSSPFSSQVLLSPGSTASVPTTPPDGLTLLLSGAGSVAQPLVVEYMAELAACAAPNVAPVHLTVSNPQTGSNMTLSVCNAAPNVISNGTGTILDFSFGWNTSRLPAVFSLANGLTAEPIPTQPAGSCTCAAVPTIQSQPTKPAFSQSASSQPSPA
ncbi:hypothetical protein Vafri_812 [Volvox africanus]|nr:hypothetical protein Vafri_812 [Volvox africanus]